MLGDILTKIFGSKHERDVKRITPLVHEINDYYQQYHELSDDELRFKTIEFKNLIQERVGEIQSRLFDLEAQLRQDVGEDETIDVDSIRDEIQQLKKEEKETNEEVLLEILPQAYAVAKETCRRLVGKSWSVTDIDITWDMIPFDVQLIGGVVLHEGKIAEMATGEGKTLVATMPLYLNALSGKGAHLVTVNDYLARRDCEWMGKIYETLGLTAAFIVNDMNPPQRQRAYNADITYGTNNEFGFDYLRDNMSIRIEDLVQRKHHYAIIDEVDSVLIDEARTPLIISGPVEQSTQKFDEVKPRVAQLVRSQTLLVNSMISEAEKLLNEGKEYEAGIKLLQASRGAPKNKKLAKILHEPGTKKLIHQVEMDYLRDKRLHELDEELYYSIDEKTHVIDLTEKGREALSPHDPDMFVLPDLAVEFERIDREHAEDEKARLEAKDRLEREHAEKSERIHNISQLLRAYSLFERDVEYVVTEDGKVMIVDEFTGRLMPGRRYSDGLHQAIEAKEGVKIEQETQTLATITLQNFFRLYTKLAGMTGTAETEAHELWQIYKLDVVVIPTNEPIRRMDYNDQIYRTKREKYNAVINEIVAMHKKNRPVLVGTISVEVSETLSRMLKRAGIKHSVLNAKYHKEEAQIVARAGQPGTVTIATNMAGRGTDIKLGRGVVMCDGGCYLVETNGRPIPEGINLDDCEADVPCGLHIIGTERHESRRIDRQLRGRSGRQGDPGSSRFYLSLEDDLMRLFGSERIAGVMDRLGIEEGEVIQHPMITRSIERAQKRVEMHNFEIRKHLLEYDDVMNQQREVIYRMRAEALQGRNLRDQILDMIDQIIEDRVEAHVGDAKYLEDWDWVGLNNDLQRILLMTSPYRGVEDVATSLTKEMLIEAIKEKAMDHYKRRTQVIGEKKMRQLERLALLQVIDTCWREHLYEMDQLKEGIGLRAYGQKDPLVEYKTEGFRAFTDMLARINEGVLELIFKAQIREEVPFAPRRRVVPMREVHDTADGMGYRPAPAAAPETPAGAPGPTGKKIPVVVGQKIGRNDPCPCGSGKKYKKCHGQ
ncbi:MAG: preprotein translocase subunit SecA [candidate division KSB1 bacterium]|nr:preprotein translocase subunit SecA [candidate division KSB1 bacterium]MDZ7317572.1 preprotein translocase subunit SecA [candidate division KSB1 bacterium]MDZ7340179.1 preprotein translocase subunit SecA [candidate division KSB1 bacterium]